MTIIQVSLFYPHPKHKNLYEAMWFAHCSSRFSWTTVAPISTLSPLIKSLITHSCGTFRKTETEYSIEVGLLTNWSLKPVRQRKWLMTTGDIRKKRQYPPSGRVDDLKSAVSKEPWHVPPTSYRESKGPKATSGLNRPRFPKKACLISWRLPLRAVWPTAPPCGVPAAQLPKAKICIMWWRWPNVLNQIKDQ